MDSEEPLAEPERFVYDPGVISFGDGAVRRIEADLADLDYATAVVVTGRSVGQTTAVMQPLKDGLGDCLAAVFAQTTSDKRLATAVEAAKRIGEHDADIVLGVGGGSSLDIATVASVIAGRGLDLSTASAELDASGTLAVPDDHPAIATIPTTLAGAALSNGAGITASPETAPIDDAIGGGVRAPSLMPALAVFDPTLLAATPPAVLRGSAMNGFNKGLEAVYAPTGTPITDATATHGLAILERAIEGLAAEEPTPQTLRAVHRGILLAQYGTSQANTTTLSLIHAFGHGITAVADVQQGIAHAAVTPAVLEFLFDRVDARRRMIADALHQPTEGLTDDEIAAAIIGRIDELRATLVAEPRLGTISELTQPNVSRIARITASDELIDNVPEGCHPTTDELEGILEAAW